MLSPEAADAAAAVLVDAGPHQHAIAAHNARFEIFKFLRQSYEMLDLSALLKLVPQHFTLISSVHYSLLLISYLFDEDYVHFDYLLAALYSYNIYVQHIFIL